MWTKKKTEEVEVAMDHFAVAVAVGCRCPRERRKRWRVWLRQCGNRQEGCDDPRERFQESRAPDRALELVVRTWLRPELSLRAWMDGIAAGRR